MSEHVLHTFVIPANKHHAVAVHRAQQHQGKHNLKARQALALVCAPFFMASLA
jgi:hypothetical protein